MTSFRERWENVSQRIEVACRDAGRNRDEVKVVAVSKKQPMDRLNEAYALGIRDFGENYAQALSQRMAEMPTDIQVMINNNEMASTILRLIEVIGQDRLEALDEDTLFFIISALNQLDIDTLRNKILLKVLPLKV